MKKRLRIQPLDPLMIRDGRPFDRTPGIRAKTLREPLPSVTAGAVRTMLAKRRKTQADDVTAMNHYAEFSVSGPLYRWKDQLYYPLPKDMELFYTETGEMDLHKVSPQKIIVDQNQQGAYGIGRDGRLMEQLWLPLGAGLHKPIKDAPSYMSETWMLKWLLESYDKSELLKKLKSHDRSAFLSAFPSQERTHVEIDIHTRKAKDQRLFSTQFLQFPDDVSMEVEVSMPEEEWNAIGSISDVHTIGGERRLAHFSEVNQEETWSCPEPIADCLQSAEYIRMVLATPAYFQKGWQPGWLDGQLKTNASWNYDVQLQLCWACVPRWQPVSGWRAAKHAGGQEKPVRRLVPAGSVYFFKVLQGNAADLARNAWLQPVSDRSRRGPRDDRDGFGLALWGKWEPKLSDKNKEGER